MTANADGAPNIILVDDTPENLRLLESVLRKHGYRVRSFPRGQLALTAAANDPPDLILLDIAMPEMNGYEVCKRLKSTPALADIPVIFLSALDGSLDKVEAFACGGVDYVSKPFDVQEVLARVETHLQLRRVQQDLAAFSYSISHDLRAPLLQINGFLQVVEEDFGSQLPDKARIYIAQASAAAERMARMIQALLHLSRVGNVALEHQSVDLAGLARRAFADLQQADPARTVTFVVDDLPEVIGDPTLLRELFDNLLGNALKFTRPVAAARLEVGVAQTEAAPAFYVRDNGVGFDPRTAGKLFRVFQRLHKAGDFEGTGIGLNIVKRIVEKHGGRVWAEGAPNQGATFWFTLAP